jgi:exosortase family protein XrtG
VTTQLALWIFAAILWAAVTIGLRLLRRWLLYYLVGALGLVLLVAFGTGIVHLDTVIESIEAAQVSMLAAAMGIGVRVVDGTGLAIPTQTGWAVFDVGLECSAILEMSAAFGLIMFYPAFSLPRRAVLATTGLVATYIINIARILLIVAIINAMGTGWVFAAHAVFGRVFFFTMTVVLYWFLLTRPTIGFTRKRVEEAAA